jgi:hypothetical protein
VRTEGKESERGWRWERGRGREGRKGRVNGREKGKELKEVGRMEKYKDNIKS